MIFIKDIGEPIIQNYRTLKKRHNDNSKSEEIFIAEGEKVVLKLLSSSLNIKSIFCTEDFYQDHKEAIISRVYPNSNIYIADKSLMSEIIGYKLHSGVMAEALTPRMSVLNDFNGNIIACNSIIDTENIGSIVRNAAAFGFNNIFLDNASSSPYLRRAVRVSLGNIFGMNYRITNSFISELITLKNEYGYKIISAEITENSYPIHHIDFDSKFVLIFGSEGKGISNEVLEISDFIVHIPIIEQVGSINVAAAAGIFMYDINNSRSRMCIKI